MDAESLEAQPDFRHPGIFPRDSIFIHTRLEIVPIHQPNRVSDICRALLNFDGSCVCKLHIQLLVSDNLNIDN